MSITTGLFAKVDTVIVRVLDLEAARNWYEQKLGFRPGHVSAAERLMVFDVGGETTFTIWERKRIEVPAPGLERSFPIFYADDIAAAHRLLGERGAAVEPIQGEAGSVQWFTFRDLDGNRLEVCHY